MVATLTETGYYNSGQDCTAPCRVLAGPAVFDGVVGQLTESAAAVKTGDPLAEDTAMGPVVSGEQRADLVPDPGGLGEASEEDDGRPVRATGANRELGFAADGPARPTGKVH